MKGKRERFVCDAEGDRLDQFLAEHLPMLSRGFLKRAIDAGAATVDGRPGRPDDRLEEGEVVVFTHREADPGVVLESRLLHEDADLLVLDKPSGLVMHPKGDSWLRSDEALLSDASLAAVLRKARPAIARAGVPRTGIVHRLDRGTSGVLIVAKTRAAYEAMLRAFRDKRVQKVYRAVVAGVPARKRFIVEAPIGREQGRQRMSVNQFGRQSRTEFRVAETGAGAALIEARPLTGRTHQIRAHAAYAGYPVMGDSDFPPPAALRLPPPPRLMLHAWRIAFVHPRTKREVSFEAALPDDLKAYWKSCRRAK